jgi:hypothetical protein
MIAPAALGRRVSSPSSGVGVSRGRDASDRWYKPNFLPSLASAYDQDEPSAAEVEILHSLMNAGHADLVEFMG